MTKETLKNCLRGRIVALRGVYNHDYPVDTSRLLHSVRFAFNFAHSIAPNFPKDVYRTIIMFIVLGSISSNSCSIKEPVLSPFVQVEVLAGQVSDIRSYKLPKGNFRGVLWSSLRDSAKTFEIWIVSGNEFIGRKELYYYIQVPTDFVDKTTNVTDDWIIEESILPKNRMSYLVKRKDGNKALLLTMPLRKQHYSFSILKNDYGDEIILFMDLSDYVVDNGTFGYVIICKDEDDEL